MHRCTKTAIAALTAGALLLAACGSSSDGDQADEPTTTAAPTTEATGELEITDVWARQSPMATTNGAVYLTITSPIDDQLIGAAVPTSVASTAEIHETVAADDGGMTETTEAMEPTTTAMGETETTMADDGSMTMQPVDAIELPAGEAVTLEPGGYHVMLLDLVEPLEAGDTFDLTLTFENAGEVTVTAEVREG